MQATVRNGKTDWPWRPPLSLAGGELRGFVAGCLGGFKTA